ncbi:acyl--CoA ligase [Kroppenstedtia guangzhouensis]|jgi:acyl-CoA synthetase (AMP-forming)/AMP-acid ligase II|uniref:Acyl--CoA ligase n=1 Tax=Kroppenstedtia guangzhouensis TaxID=1274356 RepID=A0ABQ1GR42_9BACL|nr:AMP-binding protein [Kroppenstedtia guangzhouensis]GGA48424.1 acyl--CoA ligase [Kroppenstedtia guangzhouensis]
MYPIQMPIGELLRHRARLNPTLEALIGPKRRFTYLEYDQITNQVAHYLLGLGIQKGDRIALFSDTNVLFPILYLGAAKAGAITVPINCRWSSDILEWSIQHTEPKLIFFDDTYQSLVESLHTSIPTVKTSYFHDLDFKFEEELQSLPTSAPDVNMSSEDPVCITFTSGTTGKPKGVVITHHNLCAAGVFSGFSARNRQIGFRFLYATPLFHISGTSVIGFQPLCGYTYVFIPQLEPNLLLETIEKEQINSTFLPPALLNIMLPMFFNSDRNLGSLLDITTGGSNLPLSLIRDYESIGYHLFQGYGCTETAGILSFWDSGMGYDTSGSVGKPVFGEVKVLDRHTREEVPPGEIGELAFRGPTVFKEYWRNPEATEKAFHKGWLLMGDAVRVDEEGLIYLVDRYKDVIYFSGLDAIYPSQVEKVLQQMDEISEVSVVGVQNERWGELPCAFIVPKAGTDLTRDQVLQFARERMEKHKLAEVILIDQLPKNATGKVDKGKLKEMYRSLAS